MPPKPNPHHGRRRLAFEALEGRRVLAALSMPWPEPDGISISFLPDGTSVGAQASQLYATLDALLPRAEWQETVLRAFQTWAATSNVNFLLTSDSGLPVGVLGFKQGDPRFGDVRIGAIAMGADVLATANPYDAFVANTWVGDIFLNSATLAGVSASDPAGSLFAIMLHEAGHVIGAQHSDDPASAMFARIQTSGSQGLTPADALQLQSQYGVRRPDAFEGDLGNDTLARATPLALQEATGNLYVARVAADLTTAADVDIYQVNLPAGVDRVDVSLTASGASLVTGRLTILDAHDNPVAAAATQDPMHNDLSLTIDRGQVGDTYYVRIEAARPDLFGVGAYHLEVAPHSDAPVQPLPVADDPPLGNLPQLLATTPGYVEHTYYEAITTLDAFRPAVSYRFRSADLGPDLNNVFTVVVEGYGNTAPLDIQITDDLGQAVAGQFLVSDTNHWQIQIPNARSAADYVIRVAADVSQGPVEVEVEVDFALDGSHQETFVSDALLTGETEVAQTLLVNQSQQFHLTLAGSDYSQPVETGVRMTIEDSQGNEVFSMTAADGAVRTGDVFLNQGAYTVRFTRAGAGRETLFFQLSGAVQSSAIGPMLRDTTLEAVSTPVDAALAQLSFYWLPARFSDVADARTVSRELRTAAIFTPLLQALNAGGTSAASRVDTAAGGGALTPRSGAGDASSQLKPSATASGGLDRLTAVSRGADGNDEGSEDASADRSKRAAPPRKNPLTPQDKQPTRKAKPPTSQPAAEERSIPPTTKKTDQPSAADEAADEGSSGVDPGQAQTQLSPPALPPGPTWQRWLLTAATVGMAWSGSSRAKKSAADAQALDRRWAEFVRQITNRQS